MSQLTFRIVDQFPIGQEPQRCDVGDRVIAPVPGITSSTGMDLLHLDTRERIVNPYEVHFPPLQYHLFPEGSIIGQGLALTQHNIVHSASIAPHLIEPLRTRLGPDMTASHPVKSEERIRGTTLLLPVSSSSLSHFLFEGQPFLLPDQYQVDNVIVTTTAKGEFSDLIHWALGSHVNVLYRSHEEYDVRLHLDNVIVPTYRFGLHPRMLPIVDQIIAECSSSKLPASRLLYVSRGDVFNYRIMLNEHRIEKLLIGLGFEVVKLFEMSEAEVVRCFSEARLIVGPLGAGLYNSVYSRPGTPVIALCAANYIRSFLEQCVALKGVSRAYCFGPDFLSYEATQHGGHNDFVVSEGDVLDLVLAMLTELPLLR